MQILQRLSHVFRNILDIRKMRPLSVTRVLAGDLERRKYGMNIHEQSIVRQVLAMSGKAMLVRQDTFATDKKNNLCYLEKGRQVRISENPLTFDQQGDARINIYDECDKSLSMRLSDYIEDIR